MYFLKCMYRGILPSTPESVLYEHAHVIHMNTDSFVKLCNIVYVTHFEPTDLYIGKRFLPFESCSQGTNMCQRSIFHITYSLKWEDSLCTLCAVYCMPTGPVPQIDHSFKTTVTHI